MQSEVKNEPAPRARFATTQWNLVQEAGSQSEATRERALELLLFRYRPAMCEYLRRKYGYSEPEAEDLVQGFVLDKVLRRNLIAKANRTRGKFRTFLATALKAYALDVRRSYQSQRRYPSGGLTSLELEPPPETMETPNDELLDESIIRQIVAEALHETREHCTRAGISEAWTIFNHRILDPIFEQTQPTPLKELSERLNLANEKEASNKLISAKRIFQRQFRARIAEFSASSADTDQEIEYLSHFFAAK
jgi:DNA-directed RNA polymerase specialized sigma24 family protein